MSQPLPDESPAAAFPVDAGPADVVAPTAFTSRRALVWRRFLRNRPAVAAVVVLVVSTGVRPRARAASARSPRD